MAETPDYPDSSREPPPPKIPWGPILVVAVFIGMGALAFWVTHEKKNEQSRVAMASALDQELSGEEKAVTVQREKVTDLTKRVEELRARIQLGNVKDAKAAIVEFNGLAAEQRAERDKFMQMADQYNQKVAKFHQLEQ